MEKVVLGISVKQLSVNTVILKIVHHYVQVLPQIFNCVGLPQIFNFDTKIYKACKRTPRRNKESYYLHQVLQCKLTQTVIRPPSIILPKVESPFESNLSKLIELWNKGENTMLLQVTSTSITADYKNYIWKQIC